MKCEKKIIALVGEDECGWSWATEEKERQRWLWRKEIKKWKMMQNSGGGKGFFEFWNV